MTIQALCTFNAMGVSNFQKKGVTKEYGSTLLALRAGRCV